MFKCLIVIAVCEVIRVIADIYQIIAIHKEAGLRMEAYENIMDPKRNDHFDQTCASAFKEAIVESVEKMNDAAYAEEMKNEREWGE